MKTKKKLLYIYSLSLLLVISTLVFFARYVFYSEFEELEYRKVNQINELVRAEILKDLGQLGFKNKEWSTREINYNALKNKDYTLFERNLNLSALRNFNVDLVVYGNSHRYLNGYNLSYDDDNNSMGLERIPKNFIERLNNTKSIRESSNTLEIFDFEEFGTWLITQLPVTDRYGEKPPAGQLMMGKKLDKSYFEDLSDTLAITVYLKGVTSKSINTSKHKINNLLVSDYSLKLNSDKFFVFSIFHTPHILMAGRKSFRVFFITSSLIIFLIMGLTYYILQRSLFSPIINLQNEISLLDLNNLKEISIKNADHEIFRLINIINSLISRVKSDYDLIVQKGKLESLGLMAGGIAHEINNPLTILRTNSKIIIRELSKKNSSIDKKIYNKLQKNIQTIDRIAEIINGLQRISRHSSEDELVTVNANDILNNIKTLHASIIKDRNIKLEYLVSGQNLNFKGLEQQITQILINLLMNSSQALEHLETKWIRVELSCNEDNVIFRVIDSGQGISLNIQDKLMDPFFTTKEVGEGTGLGLSISRKIAHFHNGELRLISEALNTTFELSIPLLKTESLV